MDLQFPSFVMPYNLQENLENTKTSDKIPNLQSQGTEQIHDELNMDKDLDW